MSRLIRAQPEDWGQVYAAGLVETISLIRFTWSSVTTTSRL
jgi:hypothetical protein